MIVPEKIKIRSEIKHPRFRYSAKTGMFLVVFLWTVGGYLAFSILST